MAERWIIVEDWERFQHYKDRTPLWIKNYTELMSNDAYLGLTLHQRGVLHGLWMEYARARRQIPDSTSTVSRRLGERVTRATLDSLNHAGFITYSASKPLAEPEHPASPEVEVEVEVEKKDQRLAVALSPAREPASPNGKPDFTLADQHQAVRDAIDQSLAEAAANRNEAAA